MTLLKRSITTIVGLPLVILIVYLGGVLLLVSCALFALAGLREFYLAFSKTDKRIHIIGYVATVAYFGAVYASVFVFGEAYWLLIILTLFIIMVKLCLVLFYRKLPLHDCISTIYGFFYVPFMMSFIVLVREHPLGQYFVWLIFTSSFGCDTFAYITGSLFGKNKLKNSPSPSKSYEGLVGGIIGATLIGFLYGFIISQIAAYEIAWLIRISAIISFFGATFSIVGDLAASAIKRFCEIKDFGNIFPGHGGVMDRVDSIITVAPIVYMVMNVMIWLVV